MTESDNREQMLRLCADYAAVKVDIMPLTGLEREDGEGKIDVYVSLVDSFGYEMKWPGVFRFELYERLQRSAEPKGRRIAIWPDIDLTEAEKNNEYWRDFLRAYEFQLDFEPRGRKDCILQVTCRRPDGKRLSGELALEWDG